MKKMARPSILKNQKGVLTIDFLFAMVIAGALIVIMFAFTMTLSMLQISQYVAFATARSYISGHLTQEKQTQVAREKFKSYFDDKRFPHLAPLLTNNWFEISERTLEIRGGGSGASVGSSEPTFNEAYNAENEKMPQTGVRFQFKAKILKINVPFVGKLSEDSDFSTYVTGFLIREPTTKECKAQFELNARFKAILDQEGRMRAIYQGATPGADQNRYFPLEDNGC